MAHQKTCENCLHFSVFKKEFELERLPGGGNCDSEKFVDYSDEEAQPPQDGLGYRDFEGFQANFKVGPKFGCIHFEPKG